MKPLNLCISGWGPYKDKVEIDFTKFSGQGLFLITGATGAGKTTIFDAITYALYGALSCETRDKERSSVRSDFADAQTPTYVELNMEHDGKEYFIRRNPEYFRPKKRSSGEGLLTKEKENALLKLPDGKVIEGVREVNGKLQELLGVDLPQFKQLSMIAQGEFARLLTAPPKDKTKIFREIFGTGIYERFTYNLSREAKKRYQKVAEQKAKLDEDLRILTGSFKNMEVEEELKEEFTALLELPAIPFDKVRACLEIMEQQLAENLSRDKKANEKNEKEILKKQSYLTALEEENKRIRQYQAAEAQRAALEEKKALYEEKQTAYDRAVNAGYLEADNVKITGVKQQFAKLEESLRGWEADLKKSREKLEEGKPVFLRRQELSHWLMKTQEQQEKQKALAGKERELAEKTGLLEEEKSRYVELDQTMVCAKEAYEEALRKRSYAAIGIAARLLEQGKPCPVCGSTEHPSPARLEEEICSEEELKKLQKSYEKARKQAESQYGLVVSLGDKVKELGTELQEERASLQQLTAEVDAVTEIPAVLTGISVEKAKERLQDICDGVNSLMATLSQQEKQLEEGKRDLRDIKAQYDSLETDFAGKLAQHGFADRKAYEAAYMDKLKRDALGEEIREYKEKCVAAVSLCENLKAHITGAELRDTTEAEGELKEHLGRRKELESVIRSSEYSLSEVKRSRKHLDQKEKSIRMESEEYGFIKELENIASGNNPKRLVFEQYVLASYFDEILVAANIRFRKMSGGRYEMHRCKEVSDGRVKDNLEIEVMDFYTGKARSVRTLSGGESFKASLSLALGLSDVIQSISGGIKVDTLFIDEGFGALDSESLDQACNTLNALVENDRLIGIISHVQELRERIPKQLVIEKSGSGSSIKMIL